MTNDEALAWLRRRSAVVVFHEDRMVVVVPKKQFTVDVESEGAFDIQLRDGFTIALSDPGDDLAAVVSAAVVAWRDKASPVDTIVDTSTNKSQPPAKLIFKGNPNRFF